MALLRKITVADMQIGTFTQLHTVQYDTKLIAALELLTEHKISAVPVVNDDGVLMDVFSRSDVLVRCTICHV
jgi:5'-AMP-activated protein kinase regulatory gamma subunit